MGKRPESDEGTSEEELEEIIEDLENGDDDEDKDKHSYD